MKYTVTFTAYTAEPLSADEIVQALESAGIDIDCFRAVPVASAPVRIQAAGEGN